MQSYLTTFVSDRQAQFDVRNELTGDRATVENFDVQGRDDPRGYTCMVRFSDSMTDIDGVVLPNEIIVREDLPDVSNRLRCWYEYTRLDLDRNLVLTKGEYKMMAPIMLGPLR